MKTYTNLYPRMLNFNAILRAWRKARRGKRYTHAAVEFEQNLDSELIALNRGCRGG
ncbi:MAG: hypothetical protein HS103_05070 [Anaerolineales bacterium]|nr:hypothetical protein [Anaerolineales bacterium]